MAMKISKRNQKATAQTAPLPIFTAMYIRVSTEKQADEGYSLEAQESRLQSYCDAQGWTVDPAHVYIDAGISGKSTDRPAFSAMMQAAQDGKIARIVAIKLDRLARNTNDFLGTVEKLQAFGCDLVLLKESFDTGTPHGKFALTMFAAIAELEASQIAERTMSGRKQKATQGGDNGRYTPLGYTFDNGHYSIDETPADTVRNIFTDFVAGESLTAIASRLNAQDTPTARGGKWYPATVRYILTNGFYAGLTQYDGQSVSGGHPAIITADTYAAAVAILRK